MPVAALTMEPTLRNLLLEVAKQANDLVEATNYLEGDLRRAAGGDPTPWDKGARPGDLLLHDLDPLLRRLLNGLQRAGDDVERHESGRMAWEKSAERAAHAIAERLLAEAPPDTFAGREDMYAPGKSKRYCAATAEASFYQRLAGILTRWHHERRVENEVAA
jgi:CRISPR system Cascade subunit CasA